MGHVIDVGDRDSEPAVLTQTAAGGLFGGTLLHDEPLVTHLSDEEQPKYVVRNKKRGFETDRDGDREQVAPDDSYQALAVVTDAQIVVAVGQSGGDVVTAIPLLDVVDASATDGLVSDKLGIRTEEGTSYEFACRGDLSPVAEYVDGTAQAWVRAYRLLDDARDKLDSAADHLDDGSFSVALDTVADAEADVQTARDRLAEVGDGALARFDDDSDSTRTRARELSRTVHDARARDAHAIARSRWRDGEYEQAHDQYEIAIQAYHEATHSPGAEPTDDELDRHREEAESQLAELQRVPLARAQQVAQGAVSIDGPAPAAARWENAIERYREALWLDWGRDERRFDGDPEPIRESIVDAVDNLVTERRAAARACREAARDHRMAGATDAARAAYRTALDHVERAQSVVGEVAPNRETGLEDTVSAIEEELSAVDERPDPERADRPAESPLPDGRDPTDAVVDYWTDHGWTVERHDGDLIATSEAPVTLRAVVRVLDRRANGAGGEAVNGAGGEEVNGAAGAGERFESSDGGGTGVSAGSSVEQAETDTEAGEDVLVSAIDDCRDLAATNDAALAVVATTGAPTPEARERAAERDVRLHDLGKVLDAGTSARTV